MAPGQISKINQNGNLSYSHNYTDGKLNGVAISYHENGHPKFQTTYKNDLQVGPFDTFYDNGNSRTSGFLNDEGKKHGLFTYWYPNGVKKYEGAFFEGKKNSTFLYFSQTSFYQSFISIYLFYGTQIIKKDSIAFFKLCVLRYIIRKIHNISYK